jgi:zinc/manganese transport system substrate-binding protein
MHKSRSLPSLLLLAGALVLGSSPAGAALNVFACEPEWGALVQELAGEQASVYVATTALQDPHHIQARPSLIAKVRRADLVVCTGAELEIGWLPLLLRQAGNAGVQPGRPGYFVAAEHVSMLDVPTRLDRAEGDVHPYGNPHIQTDPRNIARVAEPLAKRLAEVDPAHASVYSARYQAFSQRWQQALQRWEQQAAPLRGVPIVVQHKGWTYLEHWLGLVEVTALEPKPGVPPSSAYLAQVLDTLKDHPAKLVIYAAYQDDRAAQWLSQQAGIPKVQLAFTVGGTDEAKDLVGLYDDTLRRLLDALR